MSVCTLVGLTPFTTTWAEGTAPKAAAEIQGLATALVQLRAEVDGHAEQLDAVKSARREQTRAFAARKADLEGELQRALLRQRQLQEALDRKKADIATARAADEALAPLFLSGHSALRAHVERALPFRKEERLAALDALKAEVDDNRLTPQVALNRLWAFAEDELRMTRDAGVFKQTLEIDGSPVLAEVARLGLFGLCFRAGNDVGYLAKIDGKWTAVVAKGPETKVAIEALIDGFKRQIRMGWYPIPGALAQQGATQ